MVKGLSKRAVTVRFPETHVFEQAIFMVREERMQGVSSQDVIQEACSIATRQLHTAALNGHRNQARLRPSLWPPLVFIGIGSGITGIIWILTMLLG